MVTSFLFLVLLSGSADGLKNGLALTPMMGWNPFNAYGCDTDEDHYNGNAYVLAHSYFFDVGYKYFNMDCGWQSTQRTSSGTLTWNETRLPSGIPALGNLVHKYGLLFGVYSDGGYYSCDLVGGWEHWLGSLGYEQTDATTFAQWGADYLKYDNCFAVSQTDFVDFSPPIQEQGHFTIMRDALAKTGRPIVYSINEWGVQDPASWAGSVANSWRISNNIGSPPSFEGLRRVINQLVPITRYAQSGGWNDLDLLDVGNPGLTQAEWGTQFAFWASAKSPLLISTNLITISTEAMNILVHEGIIAVNQDPMGQSISFRRRYTDSYDVWAGPLADGSMVAVLVNWANERQAIPFYLSDIGLVSADVTDLWAGAQVGKAATEYTDSADAHGTLIYKLTSVVKAAPPQFTTYLADARSNKLAGGATLRALSSGGNVVGHIGNGGTLTFARVDGGKEGGTKLLSLTYVNADYTFYNTDCSNCRRAQVSVNGGTPMTVEFPISGQSWDVLSGGYLLSLDGFVPGPHNTITFANPTAWAPDMYSVEVEV